MKKSKQSFFIILFIPLLILLGMAIKPTLTTVWGDEIILESMPVDPRDLFYGDYVNVNLAITEVPIEKAEQDLQQTLKEFEKGTRRSAITVYTILHEKDGIFTAEEVRLTEPEDGFYVKGKVHYYWSGQENEKVNIDYQLNRFYVEENTGKEIEQIAQQGKVLVKLKVMNGYALFDELIIP